MNGVPVPMLDPMQTFARWRRSCADGLSQWLTWLLDEDLCAARDEAQLREVIAKMDDERFTVAIVAELSRGKSELINALLFTDKGRRIVPSGAGRTTMCPTEFFCDEATPPYIELLPIESRNNREGIATLRKNPKQWVRFNLNTDDPDVLARDLLRVGETQEVSLQEAQSLGLADETETEHVLDIPRWRHARINLHHPLLKMGLTVLDTPGLNALGNEPELTYAVLPAVDAVLFVLAADVGVTRSDKDAWATYLGHIPESAKWIVLNKIDSMWDPLKSSLEVRTEISMQAEQCARALGVPVTQVFPLSAQKGLYARLTGDRDLLNKSRLEALEVTLTRGLLNNRKTMLADRARTVVADIFQEAQAQIRERFDQALSQRDELKKLADSTTDEEALKAQFLTEREKFVNEGKLVLGMRKEINAHTVIIFDLMSIKSVDNAFAELYSACDTQGADAIETAFKQGLSNIQNRLIKARAQSDVAVMLLRNARNVGAIKSPRPKRLAINDAIMELERLRGSASLELPKFLPFITHMQRRKTMRTVDAVVDRIKVLIEDCIKDTELWLYSLVTPLERSLRDGQTSVRKRTETLSRASQAQATLIEHIALLDEVIAKESERHEALLQRAKAVQIVLNPVENSATPAPAPQPV